MVLCIVIINVDVAVYATAAVVHSASITDGVYYDCRCCLPGI